MPNTWIFQVSPTEIDLRDHLQRVLTGQADREGEWPVQRHARQMQAQDKVLFWQSGRQGGLLATAELLSGAYRQPADGDGPWLVGYRLECLVEPVLTRRELLNENALRQLSLLKRAQGRSFSVTAAQARCLNRLLDGRRQHFPDYQLALKPESAPPPALPRLTERISAQGLRLSADLIRRYHLALHSGSALVILAGASGLGKSWLTRAYAQAASAKYLLVPVAPNWLGPEDLLGYQHPLQNLFQPSPLTRFIQAAATGWLQARRQQHIPTAYHLVLDEINLARMEYYLAPLLSLLEVRRRGEEARLTLADGSELLLTPNLYLIGTLNMDETTQPLSDRVCDRSQIIELSLEFEQVKQLVHSQIWGDLFLTLWPELERLAPIAYRSLEDISRYVQTAESCGCSWQQAFDEQLVQKILPRLRHHRDSSSLERIETLLPEGFPLTRAKLEQLRISLKSEGFASFF